MATMKENAATLRMMVDEVYATKNPTFTPFARTLEEYINASETSMTLAEMKTDRLQKDLNQVSAELEKYICPSCVKFGITRGKNKCDCVEGVWENHVLRSAE